MSRANPVIRPARRGYIYVAICRDTHIVKIGFSATPLIRLLALRSSYKMDFFLAAVMPGSRQGEQGLHALLRPWRTAPGTECYPYKILRNGLVPAPLRLEALRGFELVSPKMRLRAEQSAGRK